MRKFKHKKTGNIAVQSENIYYFKNCKDGVDFKIPKWAVETSLEWEEIIEEKTMIKGENYEILSFYAKNIGGVGDFLVDESYIWLPIKPDGWSRLGHLTIPYTSEEILSNKNYAIHSVKRLSDGEIFIIGDYVENPVGQRFKISEFYLDCNKEKMLCNGLGTGAGHVGIHKIKKVKKILTTEDGVDVFSGDEVIAVNVDNLIIHAKTPLKTGESVKYGNYKYFHHLKNAEEFVLINTPCLSIADIQDVYVSAKKGYRKNGVEQDYFSKLISVVKNK